MQYFLFFCIFTYLTDGVHNILLDNVRTDCEKLDHRAVDASFVVRPSYNPYHRQDYMLH